MNVGAGLTGQYRDTNLTEAGFFTLVEIFQDYSYQISERLKFTQNAVAQYSPYSGSKFVTVNNQPSVTKTGESNYKVRFDIALQGKVTKHISLNLRFEYEFDNVVVPEDALGRPTI